MNAKTSPMCFVLMPYDGKSHEATIVKSLYEHIIKPEIIQAGFEALRADELSPEFRFIDQIHLAIQKSALVIADLSGNNPNIMYEIGLAHALGKSVILISTDVASVPVDLLGSLMLLYNPTRQDEFRQNLKRFLSRYAHAKA